MTLKSEHTSRAFITVLVGICLLPVGLIWLHLAQPVTLITLGLICVAGSSAGKWSTRYRKDFVADSSEQKHINSTVSVGAVPMALMSVSDSSPDEPDFLVNAFSVDLEDYFHTEVASKAVQACDWDVMPSRIEHSTMELLEILDRSNTRGTFFILGWVARKYPRLIRHISDRGHELGCHSDRHRLVYTLTPEEFTRDTFAAMDSIQNASGMRVQGYRAPSFSIVKGTEWAFDCLAELGFTYDSSVNPVYHPTYGNPNAMRFPYYVADCKLLEIPIATWKLCGVNMPVGGGAYLRLLPQRYIRAGIHSINDVDREPATLYVHPWEIDSAQPRLKLKMCAQFRQTAGLNSMAGKLERLLTNGSFAPIEQVYSNLIPQWHSNLLHLSSAPQMGVNV